MIIHSFGHHTLALLYLSTYIDVLRAEERKLITFHPSN